MEWNSCWTSAGVVSCTTIFPVQPPSYAIIGLYLYVSRPDSAVELCNGKLLSVATFCMKAGSHCSSGPQVDSGVVIVACSVGGSLSDGLWPVCPFRARTDAMSAVVASTCANGGFDLQ